MTRDDVITLAREAGMEINTHRGEEFVQFDWYDGTEELLTFAALVAAAEREECAKVCEQFFEPDEYPPGHYAAAIRNRGKS